MIQHCNPRSPPLYSFQVPAMFASLRFIWNATSGRRLRPWRSEYVKWRIETYSGQRADELKTRDVLAFVWREKGNLLRFLYWTGKMESWTNHQGTGDAG
jgi:hypothetical protein